MPDALTLLQIAYLSIMQFLDKRQEEKDLEVSLGGSSSLKGAANGTNDKSKKARKRLQARNGKGFSKISK